MFADRSIASVVDHLNLVAPGVRSLAPSAVPQARYRLGSEPLEWLFYKTSDAWSGAPGLNGWWGLELYGVDGTCLRVQDSDANFEHFGKPGGRGGSNDAGYPQLRMACLMNLGTRLLSGAAFGPFVTGEQSLAQELWDRVPANSLTILDRGFVNYPMFANLIGRGDNRHFMVRMRRNLRYTEIQELPDGSLLAELPRSRALSRTQPGLPPTIVGRIVAYEHEDGEPSRLFTTLTDHEAYPAQELIELYHERWEIEIAYDELKTHLLQRKECLRSKKPEGVAQELWGALVLYNLVRHEMLQVAAENDLPPKRISFWSSVLWMRNFWEGTALRSRPGSIPRHLREFRSTLNVLILPPRRSLRRYARHVKIKMSHYRRNRGHRRPETTEQPQGAA
jgi:hypothetical protein